MLKVISSRAELRVDVPPLEAWKPAHLNEKKYQGKEKKTNPRTVILIREKRQSRIQKSTLKLDNKFMRCKRQALVSVR